MKYENLIFEVYHEIFEEQNLFSKLPVELLIKIFKYNSEEQKKDSRDDSSVTVKTNISKKK